MRFCLSAIIGCGQDGIGMIIMRPSRIWWLFLPLYFWVWADAIGLKIAVAAVVVIAFACAVAAIDGRMAGYALVGLVFALSVIRFIVFCVMDSKGI